MQSSGGAIVNIVADIWGGMPNMGHSGAARAGMVNLTETAAFEWAQYGVRVNAVAPGYIASSGMDAYPPAMRETIRSFPDTVPLKRFGTEAEVSAAIVFLLSPAASFITGTTLRVDGGRPNVRPGMPMSALRNPAAPFDGFHLATVPNVLQDGGSD
jgi:citronellol/citronellal dehydrogenase